MAITVSSRQFVVRQEKNRFMVTVVLNCKYHVITAKTEGFDVIKAIDIAADKIDSQCKNLRERIIEHRAEPLSESERKAAEAEALAE